MRKVVRLTESEINRLVKKVINENDDEDKIRIIKRISNDFEQYKMVNLHISRNLEEIENAIRRGRNEIIEENKRVLGQLIRRADESLNEIKRNLNRI